MQTVSQANQSLDVENDVVIQITDMEGYAKKTGSMTPDQIRDFVLDYQGKLEAIIMNEDEGAQEFEPVAGDSSLAIFSDASRINRYSKALLTAIKVATAVEAKELAHTRLGVFAGKIIRANYNKQAIRFGNSFSAASRLEQLSKIFGTCFLTDREIIYSVKKYNKYAINIGKITPKNFHHPIHVYTLYIPGIHNCPLDVDEEKLFEFIETKNEAMEYFSGNINKNISIDFAKAKLKLSEALEKFFNLTGKLDIPSKLALNYINELKEPTEKFKQTGMMLDLSSREGFIDTSPPSLSQKILDALGFGYYRTLILETNWEDCFEHLFLDEGEILSEKEDPINNAYFIETGEISIFDENKNLISKLNDGDIFGEFSNNSPYDFHKVRIITTADTSLRKISNADLEKFPVLKNIFQEIFLKQSHS